MRASVVILLVLITLGLVGTAFFIWSQARKSPQPSRPAAAGRSGGGGRQVSGAERNPFRATSIRFGPNACDAVKELARSRFLVEGGEIPSLPLPECDAGNCTCTYVKHRDRRDPNEERRALGGLHSGLRVMVGEEERRSGRDRRAEEDDEPWT